jgi:uncharacterized protein YfaS (alpha-2-macroglobulin family)
MSSSGRALDIETTALAAHALLRSRRDMTAAHQALAWLVEQKDERGTWHSTQATIYAMRALLAGAGPASEIESDVQVTLAVNGTAAQELKITPETSDVFHIVSLRSLARKGRNTVALEASGKGNLAYQIVATHYVPWAAPEPGPESPMSIAVRYDTTELKKDDILSCQVDIRYNRDGIAQMTLVDLGIPPGFDVIPEPLESLKEKRIIERYSVTGRQVILYLREIRGGQPVSLSYQLRAKFPVRAKTPPSVVYQYYAPEVRAEAAPAEITVK